MKKPILTVLLTVSTLSSAIAKPWHDDQNHQQNHAPHKAYARVTHVQPVYETITRRVPEQECWIEHARDNRHERRQHSATPTIVGGIIGGAIGNELGRGRDNKKIGAVVGSLLGMSIANDIHKNKHKRHQTPNHYREIERCETHHRRQREKVLSGYDVRYRYHKQTYHTFMREHPGKRIPVMVNVQPYYD